MLVADAGLGVVASLLVLAQAVVIARVTARSFDGAAPATLWLPLTLLVCVAIGRAGAAWGFEVLGRRAANGVLSALRMDVAERRLRDHPAALDGAASDEVATAAVAGIDALETTFSRYIPQVVLAVVVPVAVLAVVAWIDPLSAAIMFVTLPLIPVFMWLVGRSTQRRTRDRWQAMALLAVHFGDVVRGLPTLRAFNRGQAQAERIAEVSERYREVTMDTLRVAFLSGAVLELAATLGIALVAVTVGVRLVDGNIGFEAALTVLLLAPELYLPLRNLAAQFHASADGRAVAERLLDLADGDAAAGAVTAREVSRGPAAVTTIGAVPPPDPRVAPIRLERVSFAYPARPGAALDAIDMEIAPGESVALTGPSGGGKSTIAAVILRLVDPTQGRLTVGTADLAGCDPAAWRRWIAWVPQRPTLFRGTVADNIRVGDPGADDNRVRAAAALAGADRFVDGLPEGFDTIVGDGGRTLSAGQRQRVALARAFLRDASLVILDEPTANLDPASAEAVGATIRGLAGRSSILLIAHRPEHARWADRVVRIEAGRVADAVGHGIPR